VPKVSVIIPNYNHARFLKKRIESVLDQTYQDFEVILMDDASTDESCKVFLDFIDDKRIRTIYNETNSGSPFKQWNKGIREASGEYIWIAESDDFADETLLEKLVSKLEEDKSVGIAYCQSWVIDQDGSTLHSGAKSTEGLDKERWKYDFKNKGKDECRQFMIFGNTIPNASAVLIRRSVYEVVGGANEQMRLAGDWLLWVKLLLVSDIAFVCEPLNYFRTHTGTVRQSSSKNGLYVEEACQVIEYITSNVQFSSSALEEIHDRVAKMWSDWLIFQNGVVVLERNKRIYNIVKNFDPDIIRRLAGINIARVSKKIKLSAPQSL
jgi:glycosyltransferase involved in cell wall biosynthesis